MLRRSFIRLAAALAALLPFGLGGAAGADGYRVSGPFVHENLAIYSSTAAPRQVRSRSRLQEAMAKGAVRVHETGNVNELTIENLGNEEVFVQIRRHRERRQAGSRADGEPRAAAAVRPRRRSPSFCVEQGRWSARGKEDVKTFAGVGGGDAVAKAAKKAMRY